MPPMMRRKDLVKLVDQLGHLLHGADPDRLPRLEQLDRRGLEEALLQHRRLIAITHTKQAQSMVRLQIGPIDRSSGEDPVTKLDA